MYRYILHGGINRRILQVYTSTVLVLYPATVQVYQGWTLFVQVLYLYVPVFYRYIHAVGSESYIQVLANSKKTPVQSSSEGSNTAVRTTTID